MSSYRRNVLVGATVLGAMVILGWMMVQFGGNVISPFTTKKISVMFVGDRADGLGEGSAVVYRGVNVGQILDVKLDPDQQRVHIQAEVTTRPPLPGNLRAYIKTTGLIGGGATLVLELDSPQPLGELTANQEIQTRFAGLSDFLPPEFTKLAEDLRMTSQKFRESHLLEDLDEQVKHAGRMMDSAQHILDDPDMRKNMQDSLANLRKASETATHVTENFEKLSKDLQGVSTNANSAITDARGAIQKTQGHIDDLAKQTSERLQQVGELLAQFQSIAGKIDKGDGTAGALINDPKLYQALVDTSRELNATISDLKRLVEQWEQEGVSLKMK